MLQPTAVMRLFISLLHKYRFQSLLLSLPGALADLCQCHSAETLRGAGQRPMGTGQAFWCQSSAMPLASVSHCCWHPAWSNPGSWGPPIHPGPTPAPGDLSRARVAGVSVPPVPGSAAEPPQPDLRPWAGIHHVGLEPSYTPYVSINLPQALQFIRPRSLERDPLLREDKGPQPFQRGNGAGRAEPSAAVAVVSPWPGWTRGRWSEMWAGSPARHFAAWLWCDAAFPGVLLCCNAS